MGEHVVAKTEEVPEGERIIIQLEGREVGVFNVDGEYYAYTNWCAHQGGPCCEGNITGKMNAAFDRDSLEVSLEWSEEDGILNCPWHGWEYRITTGECLSWQGVDLPSHDVEINDDSIVVSI